MMTSAPMLLLAVVPLLLAGERTQFDSNFVPKFTPHQIESTSDATRAGLARWAATPHGRAFLEYFAKSGCEITVVEDDSEDAVGRAPEPGIATLVAASNHSAGRKRFEMILNPTFFNLPKDMLPFPGQPGSPADAMAIAWAGEMLHIYFYAHGINLPHHGRPDFQQQWQAIAAELGMATVPHDDGDEFARPVVVRFLGRGR